MAHRNCTTIGNNLFVLYRWQGPFEIRPPAKTRIFYRWVEMVIDIFTYLRINMECELSRLSWNSWMLYKRITWWNVGIFYSFWEVLNGIEDGFLKNIWRRKRKTLPRLSFFSLSTTRTTPDQAGGAGGRQTIRTLGIHGRNDKAHEVVARKAQYQPWPEPSSSAATEKKNTSCILPWKPQDFWCWLLYFVSSVLIIYESFLMLYYIYIFRVFLCVFFSR